MSVTFSSSIIKAYQNEMLNAYGVLVDSEEAQLQLKTLTRSMFPIHEQKDV